MEIKLDQSKNCCLSGEKNDFKVSKKGFFSGLIYGIIPHTFCILFIVCSIIGATAGVTFLKKILLISHFFYFLILISFVFATISALIYLKKNGILSGQGIKRKWRYLTILYTTTIGVNLLFFMVIFPAVANLNFNSTAMSGSLTDNLRFSLLTLKVEIPCTGHAPLIIGEIEKIKGVKEVKFKLPNLFEVVYNPEQTSTAKLISLDIFKTYPATIQND